MIGVGRLIYRLPGRFGKGQGFALIFILRRNENMVVAGVFLKANLARISTVTGNRASHSLIAPKFNKLELVKNPTQDDVEAFVMAFKAFCSDYAVDKIVVNRRTTSGQGVGGAGTFIIEGVLLAASPIPVVFVYNATVAATERKESKLKVHCPTTVDLARAYNLAYEGLN